MREQIENLKSGRRIEPPDHTKSLREQIEERTDAGGRAETEEPCERDRANLIRQQDEFPQS